MLEDLAMVVVGAVLGYLAGVRQDRRSTQYSERATTVVELRERVRSAATYFTFLAYEAQLYTSDSPLLRDADEPGNIPMNFEASLPDLERRAGELVRRITSMYGYYHAKSPWLLRSTKERFEELASALSHQAIRLETELGVHSRVFKKETEAYLRSVSRAREWAEGEGPDHLPALRAAFDEEVEDMVGSRPWWRRVVGG